MKKIMIKLVVVFLVVSHGVDLFSSSYKVHLSAAWYPRKKHDLSAKLKDMDYYARSHYEVHLDPSKIRALMCPHAGYDYSGNVAAAAYRLLPRDFYKRVIVIGPSHHERFTAVALPSLEYGWYKNSLGYLKLDQKVLQALSKEQDLFHYHRRAHERDHAVNLQLPFIQHYCGHSCELVPLLVGDVSAKQMQDIVAVLKAYIDDRTLVIVSSDLTHYGQRFNYIPFIHNVRQNLYDLDSRIVQQIERKNLNGFTNIIKKTGATVCGQQAIELLLGLIQKDVFKNVDAHVVAYDISAKNQENPEHAVSYLSVVVSEEKRDQLSHQKKLTGYEKKTLLALARTALIDAVSGKKSCAVPGVVTKNLGDRYGLFATLKKINRNGDKKLRGCIGELHSEQSLYKAACDLVVAAGFSDSRFDHVSQQELSKLEISLSVLSQPALINSYKDIVIGKDGVILEQGDNRSVYLPHVAQEQGWNVATMLGSLSKKAGLFQHAWKDKHTKLYTFQGLDFSEDFDPLAFVYKGYADEK